MDKGMTMSPQYQPDWEEAKQRYRAWWAHDAMDRCAIWVTAPKDGIPPEEPPSRPSDSVTRWTDLDYIAKSNDYSFRHTFFGGEAFPIWNGGYPGHTAIPAFLGYMETLKFVQRAGKNLHISIPCQEVETVLSELSARGLFICTSCETEAEARDLIGKTKQWSKDRDFTIRPPSHRKPQTAQQRINL